VDIIVRDMQMPDHLRVSRGGGGGVKEIQSTPTFSDPDPCDVIADHLTPMSGVSTRLPETTSYLQEFTRSTVSFCARLSSAQSHRKSS